MYIIPETKQNINKRHVFLLYFLADILNTNQTKKNVKYQFVIYINQTNKMYRASLVLVF